MRFNRAIRSHKRRLLKLSPAPRGERTRPGDTGLTSLGNGSRVVKSHVRIEALGALDELNCVLGLLCLVMRGRRRLLESVQNDLFDLGADLCRPDGKARFFSGAHVLRLAGIARALKRGLPAGRGFILPGGSREAAWGQLARAVCRRAERRVFTLKGGKPAVRLAGAYLNRLGDLIFILIRRSGGGRKWVPVSSLKGRGRSRKSLRAR